MAEKPESGQASLDTEFFASAAEALKRADWKEFDLAIAVYQPPNNEENGVATVLLQIEPCPVDRLADILDPGKHQIWRAPVWRQILSLSVFEKT